MRLVIFVCGLALISGPAFGQQSGMMMDAPPQPVLMPNAPKIASQGGTETQKQVDAHLNRKVNATQKLLQQEEARLQSQFAKLQEMRAAALEKQDKKELDRIEQLEKQVVADYEKRVQNIFLSAQAQIQATPIHVEGAQPQQQAAKANPQQSRETRTQPKQSQQRAKSQSSRYHSNRYQTNRSQTSRAQSGQVRSTGSSKAQNQEQQTRKPSQSKQQSSRSRFRLFGW